MKKYLLLSVIYMDVPFTHLHTHSHYSMLDGVGKISVLVKRALDLGMPALALTDHGNLHGALEFYRHAKEKGLKPIIGYEAYIATKSRTEKNAGSQKDSSSHLTLLAMNHTGYKNLLKLSSIAFIEGFYYKPRIDKEILQQYNEGLICLSGCASSELAKFITLGTADGLQKAKETAIWYQKLFGDRYYLEIQDHGLEIQKPILEETANLSRELGIPLAATNDVHYVYQSDWEAQDILTCIGRKELRNDPHRKRMDSDQFFFRSGSDMKRALPGHEEAIERTMEIADRVNIEIDLGQRYFPVFIPPKGLSSDDYLREWCLEGLKKRYANNPKRCKDGQLSDEVLARLDRELSVISKLGFPNYFLIVGDFVRFAEARGIHHTARGSGVGALVCYALNMSLVCPLEFDLLFERFLDENRKEAPDIDIDFEENRRSEVLDYIVEKYGKDNVGRLGTFGTMAAKQSIADVGRALGVPLGEVASITHEVPSTPKTTIDSALKESPDLSKRYENESSIAEIIDYAKQIEGLVRQTGVHACGVVIADKPLTEYVPLLKDKNDNIGTQWQGVDIEQAGLLKMDILGIIQLTVLARTLAMIKETQGIDLDPYTLPMDDQATFDVLCRGETKGVFQLEGGGMRELMLRMKPDNFRDIIATIALYRPGPLKGGLVNTYVDVKHGKEKAVYAHPVLEDVLAETNGVMVYQEQVMRILNRLGNIPLGDAYSCIKAISKKKDFSKFKAQFVAGAQTNGLDKKKGDEIFTLIEKFAGYGFNKSHSTAYALLAYITAYLKAHYPVEFMAATLCGDISKRNFSLKDKTVEHIEDCQRMGIDIIPPDVNSSKQLYYVQDGKIAFALTAIKACGDWAADKIVEARQTGGKFKDIFDFCERIDNKACNKSALEALIKAGAFDSTGQKRAHLFQSIETAIKAGQDAAEDAAKGQGNLFGGDDEPMTSQPAALQGVPKIPEWTEKEKANYEKEVLGFYLTSTPFGDYNDLFELLSSHTNYDATVAPEKTQVLLAGEIGEVKIGTGNNSIGGKPNRYAMFDFVDASGSVRTILWAKSYAQFEHLIRSGAVVFMRGTMDRKKSRDNSPDTMSPDGNFIVDEVFSLEEAPQKLCQSLAITLDEQKHTEESLRAIKNVLSENPGGSTVKFSLRLADGALASFNTGRATVGVTPKLCRNLTETLGKGMVRVQIKPAVEKPQKQWRRT